MDDLGRSGIEGDTPVTENALNSFVHAPEYFETRIARRNLPELTGKAKYCKKPIVNEYREGKVKRTPMRGVK